MTYKWNFYTKYLLWILSLYLFISIPCLAQEQTGTLSGTVLDMNEKPVQGFTITLSNGIISSKTNEKGEFTFNNIPNIPIQITVPWGIYKDENGNFNIETRNLKPDYEIVKTKIGEFTIHQIKDHFNQGIKYSVKPGTHIQNVVVIIQPRMRIRTRVMLKDGTPLANYSISTVVESVNVENGGTSRNSGGDTTDSEGYFVYYIRHDRYPAEYTVSVTHNGLKVKSKKILIEEGTRYDDLVLTLDTEVAETQPTPVRKPIPVKKQNTEKAKNPSLPSLLGKLSRKPKTVVQPVERGPVIQREQIHEHEIKEKSVITSKTGEKNTITPTNKDLEKWVVNPENGHAYRKIQCRSLNDAKKQATANGAYLVAINDENEQKWLSGVFGNHIYWIGLSDEKNEGEWIWDSGEPLTYTNWGKKGRFPRSTHTAEQQDAAVMTFVNGLWHAIGPNDLFYRNTKNAIIEKDEL
ncbi:hypothetical protein JT359_08270 [Candidatus Poribacteria bacterium]|nr:hypothetical protein [Candidatus Poribacteria bacterium]